jgi:hypothetical protein
VENNFLILPSVLCLPALVDLLQKGRRKFQDSHVAGCKKSVSQLPFILRCLGTNGDEHLLADGFDILWHHTRVFHVKIKGSR